MHTIMIIDDRWRIDRSETYKAVLSNHFKIIPVEYGKDLFFKIQEETKIDLYLVDIVLELWQDDLSNTGLAKPLELLKVLRKIGNQRPIILISNEYENLVKQNKLTNLMNNIIEGGFNIVGFIVWKDFEKASMNQEKIDSTTSVIEKIKLEILRYNDRLRKEELKKVDVGIIAALEEELSPFLERFRKEELVEEQIYGYAVIRGNISTKNGKNIKFVAAHQERMGMVDSAYLAASLINKYEINHLFMIGVCGGRLKSNVNIGDIIIPGECIAYQNGKLTENGFMPDIGIALSNSSLKQKLASSYSKTIIRTLYDEYDNLLKDLTGSSLGLDIPEIKYDEMACGDIVIDKKNFIEMIVRRTSKRKLCSVDMESYSVLRASNIFSLKILTTVIKSVMDNTTKKNDEYKKYAAFMSAGFLYRILVDEKYQIP